MHVLAKEEFTGDVRFEERNIGTFQLGNGLVQNSRQKSTGSFRFHIFKELRPKVQGSQGLTSSSCASCALLPLAVLRTPLGGKVARVVLLSLCSSRELELFHTFSSPYAV